MNRPTQNRPRWQLVRDTSRTLRISIIAAGAASLLTLLAAGCQTASDEPAYLGSKPIGAKVFDSEDLTNRSLNRIVNAQAAVAARNDSTLRPYDFYGPNLNGLGQQKLDLMTLDERPADSRDPLVVYMDMPQDTVLDDRKTTVLVYLKDKGLKSEQIKIEAGPNPSPEDASPAAPGMKTLHLLDAGAPVANPEPATGGAGAANSVASGSSSVTSGGAVPGANPSH